MTCTPFTATAAPSAAIAARVLSSGVDSWHAALDGTMRYWHGAWARGVTPFDVASDVSRWWNETASRREPVSAARYAEALGKAARLGLLTS